MIPFASVQNRLAPSCTLPVPFPSKVTDAGTGPASGVTVRVVLVLVTPANIESPA